MFARLSLTMKPKELLITRLQEHIVPFMGTQGFRFSKSQLRFARKVGQVHQRIDLCLDRFNTEDNCPSGRCGVPTRPNIESDTTNRGARKTCREIHLARLPTGTPLGGRVSLPIRGTPSPIRPRIPRYWHPSEPISRVQACAFWTAFQPGNALRSIIGRRAGCTTRRRISSS
jgi:hypothetical protein